jgi:hypothetical protein
MALMVQEFKAGKVPPRFGKEGQASCRCELDLKSEFHRMEGEERCKPICSPQSLGRDLYLIFTIKHDCLLIGSCGA